MNHKSFTLIELLVVIAIIGVLAAIIVTSMSGAITKSKIVRLQAFSDSIRAQLSDSLVSYWSFNEGTGTDAKDMWEGNNGTLGGGTPDYYPTWRSGGECVSGSCLEFDGTNDYVNYEGTDVSSTFTLESWVLNKADNINKCIVGNYSGNSYSHRRYALQFYGSNVAATVANGTLSSNNVSSSFTASMLNKWHHVVGTFDGIDIELFLDGELKGTITPSFSPSAGIYYKIGSSRNDSFFNGIIDEVRIYNSAATITQIQSQYLAGLDKLLSNGAISKTEYNQRIKELSKEIVIE